MIIGTAGHIDHGKTALVRALTGVDADRLPEEKRRGITIELGYASMAGPEGQVLSFVDVPGHEKLVRTMVAGASGIDLALLLVAADDGIMPQTIEHLTILSLLGITQGAALITKIDRCEPAQVAQRSAEVRQLLDAHGLRDFPVLAVSALRGDGMAALRDHLWAAAQQTRSRQVAHQGFRMGLDRVFTLDGIGTVVAGSVVAGSVAVGDSLCLAHEPQERYRVRSLHQHNQSVTQAMAGQRCAVGLVGMERARVERGMTLCDPVIATSTQRFDVWLRVAATEERALRSGTWVHLHAGTQDLMATVSVLGQASVAPGESALAQLVVSDGPAVGRAHLWWGDRVVLRDASATRTVAGAQVLSPQAPARYRQTPERLALLQGLRHNDPATRLTTALAQAPFGVQGAQWLLENGYDSWPFDPAALPGTVYDARQQWLVSAERLAQSEAVVLAMLKDFHAKWPEDMGPDAARARRLAAPRMPPALWSQLVAHLASQGLVALRNGFVHLPSHGEQLRQADRVVAERALPLLLHGRFDPPWVRDIASGTRLPETQVRSVLVRLSRTGEVYQIVKDLFYHPKVVWELAQLARQIHAREGQVTAATYRDATGLGRKRAIQILEFLDRIGFLRRIGDIHLLRMGTPLFPVDGTDP